MTSTTTTAATAAEAVEVPLLVHVAVAAKISSSSSSTSSSTLSSSSSFSSSSFSTSGKRKREDCGSAFVSTSDADGVRCHWIRKGALPPYGKLPFPAGAFCGAVLVCPLQRISWDGGHVQLLVDVQRVLADGASLFLVDRLVPDGGDPDATVGATSLEYVRRLVTATLFDIQTLELMTNTSSWTPATFPATAAGASSPRPLPLFCCVARKRPAVLDRAELLLRPVVRQLREICVFSSVRGCPRRDFWEAASALAKEMVTRRINLLHGGGTGGYMGTIARAVRDGGGSVLGVIPSALRAVSAKGPAIGETIFVNSMHQRKEVLYPRADCFVIFPGGCGTVAEFFEVLCEHQLGVHNCPVGLLNVGGYFDGLLAFLDRGIEEGLVKPIYRVSLQVSDSPAELLDMLARYTVPPGFVKRGAWDTKMKPTKRKQQQPTQKDTEAKKDCR